MFETYKAILRGNHLEWNGKAPEQAETGQPVEVQITIFHNMTASKLTAQGIEMAEALEKLAAINALSEITDPSEWQHEQRRERQLPDRDA